MSFAKLAGEGRSSLSRGLELLQAPNSPPELLEVAGPLARALALLVDIEASSAPARDAAEPALENLRSALQLLQAPGTVAIPAAQQGMAAVAQALGATLELSKALGTGAATPVVASVPVASASVSAKAVPPSVSPIPAAPSPTAPSAGVSGSADAEWRAVDAALGAHSATNFYKGLAGGDVVASGGLFVATYQVPAVGEHLLLRVSMPGGYEFEAKGIVAWTREVRVSSTSSGATPGFGARFSEVPDEGRALIQRYVRNREPLFHDDL